jgi:hypothetical protein
MVLARLLASGGSPGLIGIKALEPKLRASDGRIPILVRRSGGSQGIVSVDYSTAGGAGSQGFVPVSGTLVWGDGDRADKLIVIEPPGGFTFLLANATGGAELATSEIQVGTEPEPDIFAVQPSTPPNSNTGGGGGAMSWEVLLLMALVVLRRAWSSRSLRSAVPHQVSNIGDPDRTRDVFYCDRWLNVAQLPKHRLRELNAIAEIGQRHSTQFSLRTSRR